MSPALRAITPAAELIGASAVSLDLSTHGQRINNSYHHIVGCSRKLAVLGGIKAPAGRTAY